MASFNVTLETGLLHELFSGNRKDGAFREVAEVILSWQLSPALCGRPAGKKRGRRGGGMEMTGGQFTH